jgi:hypothetical protein
MGAAMVRSSQACCAALLLSASGATPAAAAGHPISLEWHAPPACPARGAVLGEIDRLLGGAPPDDVGRRLAAKAHITKAEDGSYRLTLRTRTAAGEGERALRAATCQELADVAALIIALGFDPDAVAAQRERSAALPAGSAAAAPPPPALRPPPERGVELVPMPLPAALVANAATPPRTGTVAPRTGPARQDGRLGARVAFGGGVGLGGDLGSLGEPAAAVSAWGSFWSERLRVDATFAYLPPVRVPIAARPTAGGALSLFAGGVAVCPALWPWRAARPLWALPFSLSACLGVEAGQIRAAGYGAERAGAGTALWLAPRAAASFVAAVNGPLAMRLDVGAAAPLVRPSFVLEHVGLVHRPSPVVGRAGVGLELRF